jgi:hypothetical protein
VWPVNSPAAAGLSLNLLIARSSLVELVILENVILFPYRKIVKDQLCILCFLFTDCEK